MLTSGPLEQEKIEVKKNAVWLINATKGEKLFKMFNAADCRRLTVEWRCYRHGFWNSRPRLQWTLDMANEVRFIRHHMLDASRRTIFQLWRFSWNTIFLFEKENEGNFSAALRIHYLREGVVALSLHYRAYFTLPSIFPFNDRIIEVTSRSMSAAEIFLSLSLSRLVRRIGKISDATRKEEN